MLQLKKASHPHILIGGHTIQKSNKMEFPYEKPRSYIIQPRDLYDHGPNSMIEMELVCPQSYMASSEHT